MKFDIMGIVFMIVAIALAQFVSPFLAGYLGSLGGGIAGVFIVGLIAYVAYTFLTKGKFGIMGAVIFAVLIYVASMIAAYVDGMLGLGGGILTLILTGFVASLLWGYIGGKSGKSGKSSLARLKL